MCMDVIPEEMMVLKLHLLVAISFLFGKYTNMNQPVLVNADVKKSIQTYLLLINVLAQFS